MSPPAWAIMVGALVVLLAGFVVAPQDPGAPTGSVTVTYECSTDEECEELDGLPI